MSYQQYRPTQFKLLPDVVKNLLIINGILFLADYVLFNKFGLSLSGKFGLYYPCSELFKPYQFLTHLFMHGGPMHLFSNMFALWMFGNVLENVWGGKRFLVFYLITGLGAALIHTLVTGFEVHQIKTAIDTYAMNPNIDDFELLVKKYQGFVNEGLSEKINLVYNNWQMHPSDPIPLKQSIDVSHDLLKGKMDIPTVGASGAVFGVLLAFGMLFPNTVLYIYFAIPMKAKYFVLLYMGFEFYLGFANNPNDNIAHFAHLGGALFGFILVKIWRKITVRHSTEMMNLLGQIKSKFTDGGALSRLMIANIAVFLVINIIRLFVFLFQANDNWLFFAMNQLSVPSAISRLIYQPWSLITYMFVHFDFWHILFNMLVLYWTGSLFTEYLGNKKLVSTYFLGGLAGGIFYIVAYNLFPAFQTQVSQSTLIGASAGVLAVLTAIATLLPDYQVHLILFGPVKLKYIAIFSIVLYLVNIPHGNAGGQFAHLGGAFYGFLYIRQLKNGNDIAAWFDKIADLFTKGRKKPAVKVAYKRSTSEDEYRNVAKARQEQIDHILDKISQSGYDSLSKEEKEILFNASKK